LWLRATSSVLLALTLASCGGGDIPKAPVEAAKARYRAAKARGVDMSRGPCLGVIARGWVADVAHDPRQPVDDLPQNQCAAYRNGTAAHFVELDPEGNLIRAR
jgi:hypothetical protein